jgi:universal stress protein E
VNPPTSQHQPPAPGEDRRIPAPPRRILVVIDPVAHQQVALEKAVVIAGHCRSSLELYICDEQQDLPESWAGGSRTREYREMRRLQLLDELNALARPLKARGLDVGTACEWHAPLEQGIGYHVIRTAPDLVIKETHRHEPVPRASLSRTDWNLVRQVPAPLLLVRPKPWPASPRVAAAVDPCHPADRPPALDQAVLEKGRLMADVLGGALDVYHALQNIPHLPNEPVPAEQKATALALARDAVGQLARTAQGVAHFAEGSVIDGLVKLARQHEADVLVVGAVARPHSSNSQAGGTAAQLLERLDCDLLVVKPPGFISPLLVTDE